MARKSNDKPEDNASLVEVAYHDGSACTLVLHLADRRVSFVDGKATVSEETATLLREGGHIA